MRGVDGLEGGRKAVDGRRIVGRKIIGRRRLNLSDRISQRGELAQRAVEDRRAIFSYIKRLAGYQGADRVISEEVKRKTPPILHPLVHSHPVTGRRALYLDSTTTIGVEGMDNVSGARLLDEIYACATRPEFVYRHYWQVGDIVMWDNGLTMHRREPFDPAARRLMKRTTIFLPRERHIVPEGCLATEEAVL